MVIPDSPMNRNPFFNLVDMWFNSTDHITFSSCWYFGGLNSEAHCSARRARASNSKREKNVKIVIFRNPNGSTRKTDSSDSLQRPAHMMTSEAGHVANGVRVSNVSQWDPRAATDDSWAWSGGCFPVNCCTCRSGSFPWSDGRTEVYRLYRSAEGA